MEKGYAMEEGAFFREHERKVWRAREAELRRAHLALEGAQRDAQGQRAAAEAEARGAHHKADRFRDDWREERARRVQAEALHVRSGRALEELRARVQDEARRGKKGRERLATCEGELAQARRAVESLQRRVSDAERRHLRETSALRNLLDEQRRRGALPFFLLIAPFF